HDRDEQDQPRPFRAEQFAEAENHAAFVFTQNADRLWQHDGCQNDDRDQPRNEVEESEKSFHLVGWVCWPGRRVHDPRSKSLLLSNAPRRQIALVASAVSMQFHDALKWRNTGILPVGGRGA